MSSGVAVNDQCKSVFQEIKLGRKYSYVIYRLNDTLKEIIVEKVADAGTSYDAFVQDLKDAEKNKECRYAVFDAEFQTKEGQPRNKIVFFAWSPESATIRNKMVYSASKDAIKKALGEGIAKEIQATDHGDLAWSNVLERVL